MNEEINQWLVFMDDHDKEAIKMVEKNNKIFERARKEMNYLTGDAAVQRLAELREKWEMDRNSEIGQAQKEGEAKGKAEEKLEIAKNMLKRKFKIEDIVSITGLPKEEIEKLKKEI